MDEPNIRKIPGQDYESDYYVMRKPALVIFLAQDHPIGTTENAKLKAKVTHKESALVNREVDIDMKLLDEFFREQCQKTPTILRLVNHTHDEIRDAFAKIDGARYDAFFFIFLSYLSTKERKLPCIKVECHDSAVPIEEFISMVKGRADLALKPKVFLFQADDRELLDPMRITKGDPDDVFRSVKIPSDADQLLILSTLPQLLPTLKKPSTEAVPTATVAGGVVSQPSDAGDEKVAVKQDNSMLIRAFVEVLKANKDTDVLCCTPLINGKIEEMKASLDLEAYRVEKAEKLQVPLVMSTLTKKIKFYEARDFQFGL